MSRDAAYGLWRRAEGVECVGVVGPKKTVAVAEPAFALPALVSSVSGGVCSGAAFGVNVSVVRVARRWLPSITPKLSHCLHFLQRSSHSAQSCTSAT